MRVFLYVINRKKKKSFDIFVVLKKQL